MANFHTLVIGDRRIGDAILHHSLIRKLAMDGYEPIDILLNSYNADIAKLIPEIRLTHILSDLKAKPQIWKKYKKGVQLRQYNYQYAFIARDKLKHAMIARIAQIPHRIGLTGIAQFFHTTSYTADIYKLQAKKYAQLAYPPNKDFDLLAPKLVVAERDLHSVEIKFNLDTNTQYIALGPGTTKHEFQMYPAENFGLVSNYLYKHLQNNTKFLILGSKDDAKYALRLMAKANHKQLIDLTGKTTILETAAILKHCQATISNDSGLMHMSAGLSIPTLGIFTNADPEVWKPLGTHTDYIENFNNKLSVKEVFDKFLKLLNSVNLI